MANPRGRRSTAGGQLRMTFPDRRLHRQLIAAADRMRVPLYQVMLVLLRDVRGPDDDGAVDRLAERYARANLAQTTNAA